MFRSTSLRGISSCMVRLCNKQDLSGKTATAYRVMATASSSGNTVHGFHDTVLWS
jgi:hypothetical protein